MIEIFVMMLTVVIAFATGMALIFPFFVAGVTFPRSAAGVKIESDNSIRQDAYLQALEDLELDFRSGKLLQAEYQVSRKQLLEEAALLKLSALLKLPGAEADSGGSAEVKDAGSDSSNESGDSDDLKVVNLNVVNISGSVKSR
ncbi:MAG: hypothetical protein PHC51_11415 [bacterium]|nr:hypothetical protein [bacterium]